MVTNPPRGDGHRLGGRDRTQAYDPKNQRWVERDSETGKFMDQKADRNPFSYILAFLRSQTVDEYSQNTSFGPRIQPSSSGSAKFKKERPPYLCKLTDCLNCESKGRPLKTSLGRKGLLPFPSESKGRELNVLLGQGLSG